MAKTRQSLDDRVLHFVKNKALFGLNKPLVVGISGGPDSLCMLYILQNIRHKLGIELYIAHLNHQLRGAESEDDAGFVADVAARLGIPAAIEKRDVHEYRKRNRLTLEEAARLLRYDFFAEIADRVGADTVAVGHNADDQVETILMNLLRGAGLFGLRGMQPLSIHRTKKGAELKIARPLLEIRKADIDEYCADNELYPRSDSSNLSPRFTRNRIRHRLIPQLRTFNPDIDEVLLRTSRIAGNDISFLEEQTDLLWSSLIREHPLGIEIFKKEFSGLHPALQHRVVRRALNNILGDLQDIEAIHVENIIEALAGPAGVSLSLPRNLAFHNHYDHGLLTLKGAVTCPFPTIDGEFPLTIPGDTQIGGWLIRSSIINIKPPNIDSNAFKIYLDLDAAGRELKVRSRRRGDRFQPLGMEGSKKLQDFMVDSRIPRTWRDRIPLVCSGRQIIWVVGWRIDHRVRILPGTRQVLCLEFVKRPCFDSDKGCK